MRLPSCWKATSCAALLLAGALSLPAASLTKGKPWTEADLLQALDQKANPADIVAAIKQDKADFYSTTLVALGLRGVASNSPLMLEVMMHSRSGGGPAIQAQVEAAVAQRRLQSKPLPKPVDSPALRAKAKAGDPAAKLELSYAFTDAKVDDPAFPNLSQAAAKAGYAPAAHVLGSDYASVGGKKELEDDAKAAAYYRQSAEAGSPEGAYKLGMAFAYGNGVATNLSAAEHWFLESAARSWDGFYPKNFSEGMLNKLYSFSHTTADTEAGARWAREMIRRGGLLAKTTEDTLASERAYARFRNAMKTLPPEVPAIQAAELAKLETAAKGGDVPALFKLAAAYAKGAGVLQNDGRAAEYYRRAAEKGSAEGALALGDLHRYGRGAKLEGAQYIAWLKKATELGSPVGWQRLGLIYAGGDDKLGIKTDQTAARDAFEKGAAGGDMVSVYMLGIAYQFGSFVPKDRDKALAHMKRAAEGGHPQGMSSYAAMLLENKVPEGAAIWYRKAVEAGQLNQRNRLATALSQSGNAKGAAEILQTLVKESPDSYDSWYQLGQTLELIPDPTGALAAYEKTVALKSPYNFLGPQAELRIKALKADNAPNGIAALTKKAEAGDAKAMMQLAEKLAPTNRPAAMDWVKQAADKGEGRAMLALALQTYATDKPAALEWLKKAVATGDPEATFRQAGMMFQGTDVPKDVPGAIALMKEAADAGFPPAQFEMGRIILGGNAPFPATPAAGAELIRKAAEANFPQAVALMGELFERGMGVPKNDARALDYYERAQKLGVQQAGAAIQRLRAQMKK
ncbi:MAG: tetratricopeptide repeat protein [Verrucomicrobiota bacterium]